VQVRYRIARQYWCRLEEGYYYPPDGSAFPSLDCKTAFQIGGSSAYPVIAWNDVSDIPSSPNDLELIRRAVPDGLLCAGGDV